MTRTNITPYQRSILKQIDASPTGVVNLRGTAPFDRILTTMRAMWDKGIAHYYACGSLLLVSRDETKMKIELAKHGRTY